MSVGVYSPIGRFFERPQAVGDQTMRPWSRTCAAEEMPTVVGAMMPFRFGYACRSACVSFAEFSQVEISHMLLAAEIIVYAFSEGSGSFSVYDADAF